MDYKHINDKVNKLNILKDDISKSLLEAKIIFSKEEILLINLIKIEQIYSGFYYDFEDYIKNKYEADYLDALWKLCKLSDINIIRDGNSIFGNEFDGNSNTAELDILNDKELIKQFNQNFNFDYLLTITSEFEIILDYFEEENFDIHFKEYLSIDKMLI
ncbi:hypothetical protein [[Clostridium] colinum]|uniref:hypothetical protein n=1 Tax=[Clostridium] colinum TaxID=36835 RepID=UPI002025A050|nr:hypothetical protein [[Clostridium] colinum]